MIAATSLVQGGSGHHLFSSSVFNYIRGMSVADILVSIDEVPRGDIKHIAQEVI